MLPPVPPTPEQLAILAESKPGFILIREARQRGMTVEELAEATGMSAWRALEVWSHTARELERVEVALDWPPGELVTAAREIIVREAVAAALARRGFPPL